jgi:fatty acid desaturase
MKLNPTFTLCSIVLTVFLALFATAILLPHPSVPVLGAIGLAQALTIFMLYIVIHDAAHRTASKNRTLNDAMLFACGIVFMFDPYLYRRLHLTHHAHTNEDADPDHFTASQSLVMRWVKSFFIAPYYYVYSLKRFRHSANLLLHLCFTPALFVGASLLFFALHKTLALWAAWFIPNFTAIGFLGFVLTAWPHHPGSDTSRIGSARNLDVPKIVQWLLGYQHLHLVHHYAPTVQWYRLPTYWAENKERLVAKGAPPIP